MSSDAGSPSLYSKEELLSQYQQAIDSHEEVLIRVLSPASLVPFTKTGIISEELKSEWSIANIPKQVSRKRLITHVLESDDVAVYINFSRCLQYINAVEARRIFPFITDLFDVGLHDPISSRSMYPSYITTCLVFSIRRTFEFSRELKGIHSHLDSGRKKGGGREGIHRSRPTLKNDDTSQTGHYYFCFS